LDLYNLSGIEIVGIYGEKGREAFGSFKIERSV